MKVLMISTDSKIFEEGSAVNERIKKYGELVDELHVIVFTKTGFQKIPIGKNTFAYPTNSPVVWSYIRDAVSIGKKLNGIDLVTTQDPFETGLAGYRLSRKLNTKLQLQIHTDFKSPFFIKEFSKNLIRLIVAKCLIPKADCVRVVSKRIANSIKTERTVLPIFVDIEKIRNSEALFDLHKKYPQFKTIILMVSRLSREKNVSLGISAMKKIVKLHPSAGLVIVGDGPERKRLESKSKRYNLSNNIMFEGWQKDTISYYKTADLLLNTSSYEGYGMSLIEAGASSLAIVTTDVGLIGEVLHNKESALVYAPGSTLHLIKHVEELIKNKEKRLRISENAQKALNRGVISNESSYLEQYKKSWQICGNTK